MVELVTRYQLSVEQASRWNTQLRQQAAHVLTEPRAAVSAEPDVGPPYATIGRLQMENQVLKKVGALCVVWQHALVQASGEVAVQARYQAGAGLRVAPSLHIFNSDLGSQFTSLAYEQVLSAAGSRLPQRPGMSNRQCLYRTPLAHRQMGAHLPQPIR